MTFASPLFLLGLMAVAIPIAVHLFHFRRYKKVYFSNVEYLEAIQSETRRQSRLRQLLILAARILAIVFLVLAFAQPVIPNKQSTLQQGSNDVSIFVDNSFSMENTDGNQPLLEIAKEKAREIVRGYGQTDRFQLLSGDLEGRQFHWLSQEEMLVAIDELEVSSASPTLAEVAQRQFDFVRSGSGANHSVYYISDFQSSIADLEEMPEADGIGVTLVPLAATAMDNLYIDSLALGAPAFYKGNNVTAQVWVRNDGDENLEKIPLSLYLAERQRALAPVDLPAHSTTMVEMHFTIEESGVLDGRVELVDYPITFDDRYYFSLNIRDRIRMLIVEGHGNNEYLQRLFGDDEAIALNTVAANQMDYSHLDEVDVLVLDELSSIGSGLAQTLHSFVDQGGTVVVVAAEQADATSYNAALASLGAPRLGSWNSGRVTAARVELDNTLYTGVFSGRWENMELPTVTGYYALQSDGSTLRQPLITLANGDDYLCCTPSGDGLLYLVATPLRDEHTDFVRQALFVPTFYNMALYSVRPTPPATSLDSRQPVPLAAQYDDATGARLQGDDYEEIPDLLRSGGHYSYVPHGSLQKAGNYHTVLDGTVLEGLSFNYSRRESQMQFLTPTALGQRLKACGREGYSIIKNAATPLDTFLRKQREGRQLWRWCVVLSLLMLLAETALIRLPHKQPKANEKT